MAYARPPPNINCARRVGQTSNELFVIFSVCFSFWQWMMIESYFSDLFDGASEYFLFIMNNDVFSFSCHESAILKKSLRSTWTTVYNERQIPTENVFSSARNRRKKHFMLEMTCRTFIFILSSKRKCHANELTRCKRRTAVCRISDDIMWFSFPFSRFHFCFNQ